MKLSFLRGGGCKAAGHWLRGGLYVISAFFLFNHSYQLQAAFREFKCFAKPSNNEASNNLKIGGTGTLSLPTYIFSRTIRKEKKIKVFFLEGAGEGQCQVVKMQSRAWLFHERSHMTKPHTIPIYFLT